MVRVYNGMKYKGSIVSLHKELLLFKSIVKDTIIEQKKKQFALLLVSYVDTAYNLNKEKAFDLLKAYKKEATEKDGIGLILYHFLRDTFSESVGEQSVVVYPTEDGSVYLIPFLKRDLLKDFKENTNYVPFAYWDHTDPEESVSAEEWKGRGEIWESLLEGENIYSYADGGFSFIFENDLSHEILSNFESYIPTEEVRLKNLLDSSRLEDKSNIAIHPDFSKKLVFSTIEDIFQP